MKIAVSVLITTSGDKTYLPHLLQTIEAQSFRSLEVIIVNQKYSIKLTLPSSSLKNKIRVINLTANIGFCKANNLAARQARGKYLFFVNDDIYLAPKCIDKLYSFMENKQNQQIAVLQPKIRSAVIRDYFEYAGAAGGFIDRYGYCFCRGRIFFTIEEDKGQYDKPEEIFWATGAAFFIRKNIFQKFGGFDERFYAYHEETDLCWRLRNAGYGIHFVPRAVVYHYGERSWRQRRFLKIFLIHRNHYWFLAKNYPASFFVRILLIKIYLDLAAFFWYLIHSDLPAVLSGILGSIIGLTMSPFFFSFQTKKIKLEGILDRSVAIDYFVKGYKNYFEVKNNLKGGKTIKTKPYQQFFSD